MPIDLDKTLEQLDGHVWDKPDPGSYLVKTCHELHKKPLIDFTIEDLRIMIGQSIDLEFLIPIAIEQLKLNILAEGHFYEGDLLNSVLTSEKEYWLVNNSNWRIVCGLFERNSAQLNQFDTTKEIKEKWFKDFERFRNINNPNVC